MKKIFIIIFLLYFVISISFRIHAETTFYVRQDASGDGSSWEKAAGNIQSMIDKASIGDEIWVAYGSYSGFKTVDGVSLFGGFKGIESNKSERICEDIDNNGNIESWEFAYQSIINTTTYGHYIYNNKTYIDGFTSRSVFYISGGMLTVTNCIFEKTGSDPGFSAITSDQSTIENCLIRNNKGRGVKNTDGIVRNCIIYGNTAYDGGAGILNKGGLIEDCWVYDNIGIYKSSAHGAGISNATNTSNNSIAIVRNCIVFNNTFSGTNNTAKYSYGGGIYNEGGIIENCSIYNNIAHNGGGVYNEKQGLRYAYIKGSSIYDNFAHYNGGGIYNMGGRIENSKIYSNSAYNDINYNIRTHGGGIYNNNGKILYSHIYNNSAYYIMDAFGRKASGQGGGVCSTSDYSYDIINCIINNNESSGIYCSNYSLWSSTVVNNIINCDDALIGGSWATRNSIVSNSDLNINFLNPTSFIGNAKNDIQSNELITASWELKPTSLYIDAGDSSISGYDYDFAGNPRIVNNIIDLGAYEYQGNSNSIDNTNIETIKISVINGYIYINEENIIRAQLYNLNGVLINNEKNNIIKLPQKGTYIIVIQKSDLNIIHRKIIW